MTTLPWRERVILLALATMAAVGAMLLASPDADADTNENAQLLCAQLDVDSSPQSFYAEARAMFESGMSMGQAFDAFDLALTSLCPQYRDEFDTAARLLEKNNGKTPLVRAA